MKRFCSMILAIACLLTVLPFASVSAAFTNMGIVYTITNNSYVSITDYVGTATYLSIPSEIEGLPVKYIERRAFYEDTNLKYLVIPEGVISIGISAFEYCSNLTTVSFPKSIKHIDCLAFNGCNNLIGIDYGGSAANWNQIDIEDGNTILLVRVINYAPGDALPEYDYIIENGSVTITAYNKSATHVVVPREIDGYTVTKIGEEAFYACGTESVTIPNSVTSVGKFTRCGRLKTVSLPDTVTYVGGFKSCGSLESVILPKNITSLHSSMFVSCDSLKSLTFMGMVTYTDRNTFIGCSSLKDIYVNFTDTEWFSVMHLFSPGDGMPKVTYHYLNSDVKVGDFEIKWHDDGTGTATITGYTGSETELVIPSKLGGYTVIGIGKEVFKDNTILKSVTIPESVSSIGGSAFSGCTNLTNVMIPYGVTCILDSTFENCNALTSVTIPDSVTSIGDYAFRDCNVLADIYYSGTKEQWNAIVIEDSNYVLKNATIHYNWTEPIQGDIFDYRICEDGKAQIINYHGRETDVVIPSTIGGYTVTSIGYEAFLSNSNVVSVTIPDGVTSIGEYAFCYCSNLRSVTIPDSLTSIGKGAFGYCSGLTDAYYTGSEEEWDAVSIGVYNDSLLKNATIHYNWVPETPNEPLVGDLTGDGIVDMFDAMALYTTVSGSGTLTEAQELAADINADGTIDMFDALALYMQVSGQ